MAVTVELPEHLDLRLRREAAKLGIDPGAYVARALEEHLRARETGGNGAGPTTSTLPAAEADLLQRINAGLPAEIWTAYRGLQVKRDEGTLTPAEHEALVALSDQIEEANAARLALVAQLARLRGIPFDSLVRDLGLPGGPRA